MNVLLVNSRPFFYKAAIDAPIGILAIGSYLKNLGHNVKICDRALKSYNVVKEIKAFKADVIGISCISTLGMNDSVYIAKQARKTGIPIIAGGHQACSSPEMYLHEDRADYVIDSEGEEIFADLLEMLEGKKRVEDILGVYYLENGEMRFTGKRPFADISNFKMDWSMLECEKYFRPYYSICKRLSYMYTSKGCPFSCKFCFNHDFHRSCHRNRSMTVVLEEIKYLMDNHGLDGVYFIDELFAAGKKMLHDKCNAIIDSGLKFAWGCEIRIGDHDEEDIDLMYKAGCRWVFAGIDSGNEEIRKKINKTIDIEKTAKNIEYCQKKGMTVIGSFILGYPGETPEQLKESCQLSLRLDHGNFIHNFNHYEILPLSEFYKEYTKTGEYDPPKDLKGWGKINATEYVNNSMSKIPYTDLNVVRCYMLWKNISASSNKHDSDTSYFKYIKSTIKEAARNIFRYGIKVGIPWAFKTLTTFLHFVRYTYFYPSILKKYGIK